MESCGAEDNKDRKRQSKSDIDVLEVRNPLSHACDSSNDVAVGNHDALGDACGATGVHDDSDVRGFWRFAADSDFRDRGADGG